MSTLTQETTRHRTFAIVSHPDAGKTMLTEKLLLFGDAIQMAGIVKAHQASRPMLTSISGNLPPFLTPKKSCEAVCSYK